MILTEVFSDRLRPGSTAEITYQASCGVLERALRNLLFHLRVQRIAVTSEEQDELAALVDALFGDGDRA